MFFIQLAAALIVTLGVLIVVHELGHYFVARLSGVGIVRFSIGIGSTIWKRTDRRGTEWVVAALPIGGYVRMLDARETQDDARATRVDVRETQDDARETQDDARETRVDAREPSVSAGSVKRSFDQLSPWWRIAIALGGPLANFVLAFAAFLFIIQIGTEGPVPAVAEPVADSPAAVAGIEGNVEIVSIDGRGTPTWQAVTLALARRLGDSGGIDVVTRELGGERDVPYRITISNWLAGEDEPDLLGSLGLTPTLPAVFGLVIDGSPAAAAGFAVGDRVLAVDGAAITDWRDWQKAVEAAPGRLLIVTVSRAGTAIDLQVTPQSETADDGSSVGRVGVGAPRRTLRLSGIEAISYAAGETWRGTVLTIGFVQKMVTGLVSSRTLSGPITIATVARDAADLGLTRYVELLALLSISLGVLNLLPIPVLDGGHVLFASIELLIRKPLSERVQSWGLQVGFAIVGGLMLLAIYNDLQRVVGAL